MRFRPWLLLLALLCSGAWLACTIDQAPPAAAERWPSGQRTATSFGSPATRSLANLQPQAPRGWRRTAQGWQRADAWQPLAVVAAPSLHPLTVALFELLLSLAVAAACTVFAGPHCQGPNTRSIPAPLAVTGPAVRTSLSSRPNPENRHGV